MERTCVHLNERQIDSLNEMVRQKIYSSPSEAIRAAVALLEDKHGIHGKPAITPASPDMEVPA
jgi:Arc/MetJ-type ribon-helix-helix transcriptional regulator